MSSQGTVRTLGAEDIPWTVGVLADRRRALTPHAPVFWRPAAGSQKAHADFLTYVLAEGGVAFRTDRSVVFAAPRGEGWLVDDLSVLAGRWQFDGVALWEALAGDRAGVPVRLVCPTYEDDRADFARGRGLRIKESWWLLELPGSGGGSGGAEVSLPGAAALTVDAPPVYSPGGPILLLPSTSDSSIALPAARGAAPVLGCAAIVVNQPSGDVGLGESLADAGFRRHCDYFTGVL